MMRRCTKSSGFGATLILGLGLAFTLGSSACDDDTDSTALRPQGPPEILQVFVQERVVNGTVTRTLAQLAYGAHPDIATIEEDPETGDDGQVTNAVARGSQRLRIVFDELLRGNGLEEIACADGSFSDVPVGTSPNDIDDCAGPIDTLGDCTKVCVGADGPIGVLDEDEDGAADDFRFIDGVVTLDCGGVDMPYDLQQSFYQPSGNQQITAGPLGVNSLGPAIIIVPTEGLRTGSSCTLSFTDAVVDKDGIQPCARAGGDPAAACNPGDVSAISFVVEALRLTGSSPLDGQENVALTSGGGPDANLLLQFNAAIDGATMPAIQLFERGNTTPLAVTYTLGTDDPTIVTITVAGGLSADTDYDLVIGTGLADQFGGALPAEVTLGFSTGMAAPMFDAAPTPDADTTDAGTIDA